MSVLDIILLIFIIWYAIKGFSNGLIKELIGLIALIAGVWCAVKFSFFFESSFESIGKFAGIASFIITFLGVLVGIYFIGKLTEKIIALVIPNIFNKIAGVLFSILKIALIFSTLFYYIGHWDKKEWLINSNMVQESILYKPISKIAPIILPKLSELYHNDSSQENPKP